MRWDRLVRFDAVPVLLRNILAVVVGLFACMVVNGVLSALSVTVIAPPEGVNVNDPKSLIENIGRFEPKHFIMPFLAHALGSVVGAAVAALIAASRKLRFAMAIGCVHLLGGIAASMMIPAPTWFIALDLVVAYLPAAFLGGWLVTRPQ